MYTLFNMHPLIQRVLAYRQDFMDSHQGQEPDGPFIIYESEWQDFARSDAAAIHFEGINLQDTDKLSLGGMTIKVLHDLEPIK